MIFLCSLRFRNLSRLLLHEHQSNFCWMILVHTEYKRNKFSNFPVIVYGIFHKIKQKWAPTWQNQQCGCAPSKDSDQPGIRPVWSESSLSAWRKLRSLATYWAHSQDSDQTGRMPRVIWVFAGCTLTLLVLSCCGSNARRNITTYHTFVTTRQKVSSGVSDQARHKPACAATEAS